MSKEAEFWESIKGLADTARGFPSPENLRLLRGKIQEADAYYMDEYLGQYCRLAVRYLDNALKYKSPQKIEECVELACDRVVRMQDGLRVAERRKKGLPDSLE